MAATAPEATPAKRGWLDRWWLLLANLLVANAVSLHVGPGGLRTPSPAVNLWITALVLLAPLLRWSLRRFHWPGMLVVTKVLIMTMCLLVTAVAACLLGTLLGIAVLFALATLAWIPARPSFWLVCLAGVITVLFVDALRPSPHPTRLARMFSTVRAFACLPAYGLLAAVLVHVPINTRAWVGGADSMFSPVARIDDGTQSYVAVCSDPMAFTRPVLRILVTTPLVPCVLGWWREIGSLYNVGTADMHLDGDELCIDYPAPRRSSDSSQPLQRRIRIR